MTQELLHWEIGKGRDESTMEFKNEEAKSKSKGTTMILVLDLVSHEVLWKILAVGGENRPKGESSREREERDGEVGK